MTFQEYGSRVDNDFDSRLVTEYLNIVFTKEVVEGGGHGGGCKRFSPEQFTV